jgi:hypothetical protein
MARRRVCWPYVWIAVLAITHRVILFSIYRADFQALAEANPDWLTMQLLPLELLRANATAALVYLQQTPPVPNLLMIVAAKWLVGPVEMAYAMILLQTIISSATALLLVRIILLLFPRRRLIAAVVGSIFILNTDLVVLEYNSLGQTFYENLSMLLALASVALLIAYRRTGRAGTVIELGAVVALLALTRASWSFFAVPASAMVAMLSRVGRVRAVTLFLVPVALLHGGWCIKNWLVFGELSPTTSTWGGVNLANGIVRAGFENEFRQFIAAHQTSDSGSLRCFMVDQPLSAPAPVDADHEITARLGPAQPGGNTIGLRLAAEGCQKAVLSFCSARPTVCARKMWRTYELFWKPIAYYGYVDLFAVGNALKDSFDLIGVGRLMVTGALPDRQYLVSGALFHRHVVEANFFTLRWLDPLIRVANIIAVHILAPLLLVSRWLTRPADETRAQRRAALVIALGVYGYLALVASVAEYGENMRFRLDVEPVIWLITLISFAELFSWTGQWVRPSGPARHIQTDLG